MAVNPHDAYPSKTTAPTTSYPYGGAQNVTSPGDGTGTPWIANLINDIFGFQQALLSNAAIVPSGSPDTALVSQYYQALEAIFALKTDITTTPTGVRQTVQSASVDSNGYANFISIGTGLAVNIAATTTPIKIHAAGGAVNNDRLGTISADTTITGLTDNATNYLYADIASDGTVTLLANTVAHVEQFGGTPTTTNNLLTFNIGQMKGYTGNGSTAPQTWRVPIGEAVTSGGVVTSVVNYALNGIYESALVTNLPGTSTSISKNHNLGCIPREARIVIKNRVTQAGYPVGIELLGSNTRDTNGVDLAIESAVTSLTMVISTSNNNAFNLVPYAGGGATAATQTSWDYKFICKRGW